MVKRLALMALIGAACAFLLLTLGQMVQNPEGEWDFIGLYTAGKIVRQGSARRLYDVNLQKAVEHDFLPRGRFFPLDHPPFEAWLGLPLAYLSFPHAFAVWGGLNLVLFGLVLYLLARVGIQLETVRLLVWLAACVPLLAGVLLLGQDSLLILPAFILGFLALKTRKDFSAGLALGLGLFRFEIMFPLLFVFLLRRRWRVLAGFSIASLAALLASLALVGWGGLIDYSRVLLQVGHTTGSRMNGVNVATMPTLRGAVATLSGQRIPSSAVFFLILVGTLALLGWAAWEFRSMEKPETPAFDLEFSLAVLAALLSSYHLFVHELTPLIVIGYLMLGYEGTRTRGGYWRNRGGTALFLLFALVYGVGGAVFHFRDFSVLFIVLLGMMIWLSQELFSLRKPQPGL